jgi:hypothetical protein
MGEPISDILTAIATIAAAVAAWCSFQVSRRSLDFQKNYAKNQQLLGELSRAIYKIETLQWLIPKPLETSDEEYEGIEPLLADLKSELERFGVRGLIDYKSLKISSVRNIIDLVGVFDSLGEARNVLDSVKANIFK